MITREEMDALFELAARAPKSQTENLWLVGLAKKVVGASDQAVEDAPVEDAPAEDAPVEDAPAEDAST